jgi:AraC-like DNA-binding protein
MEPSEATLSPNSRIEALNGGLFVSPGHGRHPVRTIDSHEFVFVKSGNLGIFEGEDVFEVGPGQALILSAGRRHGGTKDYSQELQFYWIHFRLKAAQSGVEIFPLPRLSNPRRPDRIVELLRMFLDDQESGGLSRPKANVLVELLLLETLEGLSSGQPSNSEERLAANAENIMKARFREQDFGASKLAGELKCNADYLNRVFKRARGMTLTEGLRRLRVNFAAQLLLDGRTNVEEAAQQSGFSDRSYLRRVFKQLKGMTPKDYRGIHLRMHINTK